MATEAQTPEQRKQETIERLTQAFRERLEQELDLSQATLDQMTLDQIEQQVQKIGKATQEDIRNEVADACGTGYDGTRGRCACGAATRFVGLRPRQIVTLSGTLRLVRACYHCRACRRVVAPLDARLELLSASCSRRVLATAVRFCSYLPFALAAREMEAVCGVRLAASTLERYAQQTGAWLQADWEQKERLVWAKKTPPSVHRPAQLQGAMDGAMIFVDGEWREAKLGVVYEPKINAPKAKGMERARYYATLENSAAFGRKMRTLAVMGGSDRCGRVGIVADGGTWIWQEVGKYFAGSVQVLDYFHATQHLWEAAHAQFGEDTPASKAWMERQEAALLSDGVTEVIAEIERWQPEVVWKQEMRRKLLAYLHTHQRRMQYGTFRKQGWHIGSGVVEAGCKCVIKSRMGGAGMRWGGAGAEAMLHLCAHWRSDGGADFLPYVH